MTVYQVLALIIVSELVGIGTLMLGLWFDRLWLKIVGWVLCAPVVVFILALLGWGIYFLWNYA